MFTQIRAEALIEQPPLLQRPDILSWREKEPFSVADDEIARLFPLTQKQPFLTLEEGTKKRSATRRLGVLFSGGPAAGAHNVVAGILDALSEGSTLLGFLDGARGLIENRSRPLDKATVAPYRNQGGFDLLGSSRTKLETTEQFIQCHKTLASHKLDGLVIVGGDDSNTNAAFLAEFFAAQKSSISIVGVPKTIDGDLQNRYVPISFGFDTAARTYAHAIGSLLRDALSQRKYYFFIKLMGRSASHLVLRCALETHPNLTFISEEVALYKKRWSDLVGEVVELVEKRAEQGKNYGGILIPEGLAEAVTDFDMPTARDPHGNPLLSQIETERLLISHVEVALKERAFKGAFVAQPLFFGYEGRSCYPSPFDCAYGYALGKSAALLIQEGKNGYMATWQHLDSPIASWYPVAVPIVALMAMETRKEKRIAAVQKNLVDLHGPAFQKFDQVRASWRYQDLYQFPPPIQFTPSYSLCTAY